MTTIKQETTNNYFEELIEKNQEEMASLFDAMTDAEIEAFIKNNYSH